MDIEKVRGHPGDIVCDVIMTSPTRLSWESRGSHISGGGGKCSPSSNPNRPGISLPHPKLENSHLPSLHSSPELELMVFPAWRLLWGIPKPPLCPCASSTDRMLQ